MADDIIRQGIVSSINYKKGMIKVTYPDRDNEVTDNFPVLSLDDEYRMPAVGDWVLVAHLSNGSNAGVVLGKYWDSGNLPEQFGKAIFRKELGSTPGAAYLLCENDEITFHDSNGTVTLSQIINAIGG